MYFWYLVYHICHSGMWTTLKTRWHSCDKASHSTKSLVIHKRKVMETKVGGLKESNRDVHIRKCAGQMHEYY